MTRFTNNLKTTVFLAALFALVLALGQVIGGMQGLIIAFAFGVLMNGIAYFYSDKIALATMQGQEVNEQTAPDLVHMVKRLADNAGLPMPRVYICPQQAPNAFATGRNPKHAAVAVTQGALRLLTYDELEGVLGHELSHVKNRDTLTSCVAATIAGAISFLYYLGLFFGGSRDREGNPILMLLMILLAPIAASLIQLAISRSREYVADHDGAELAGSPNGLISALEKLESVGKRVPMEGVNPAFHNLFIIEPVTMGQRIAGLFATHPPTSQRIARLREMA